MRIPLSTYRIQFNPKFTFDNASDILAKENIDGCLPGGASLDAGKLGKIIKS